MKYMRRASEPSKPEQHETGQPDRRLAQPFAGWTPERMTASIDNFIAVSGLEDYDKYIRRGAFLAQKKDAFPTHGAGPVGLTLVDSERKYLNLESSPNRIDKFNQPWRLYALVFVCSLGAAVQGWDETAVNGAQVYYTTALRLEGDGFYKDGLVGLVNSAPYLCCAFSCWLNYPLNRLLNRRGVIFLTCLISSLTCLGQAFPQSWQRAFFSGWALAQRGELSTNDARHRLTSYRATIPIYAAEAAPSNIRGALVMMWQMWTAFGIMCGYIAGVALAGVGDRIDTEWCEPSAGYPLSTRCSLNWRLMLASPMVLPLIVVAYIYTLPESPRWLVMKAREGNPSKYEEAFMSLCKLRHTKLQAGRDLFLIDHLLEGEEEIMQQQKPFSELFTRGRNRRALTASIILMFLQQFCGVNVTAYYSSTILKKHASYSAQAALLISMGFGIINFTMATPAIWTIDTFGRRNLLLATFPFMAISQVIMVIAFSLSDLSSAQHILVILGMYFFAIAYSPGLGPVPFVYSAESMPLYNRDFGMGIVTSINWFWNFFISITWPKFSSAFTVSGAFGWYAAWCVIGWWMVLLFVPETKDLTLEQLDQVFGYGTREHIAHGVAELKWFVERFAMGRKGAKPVFLREEDPEEEVDPRGYDGVVREERVD